MSRIRTDRIRTYLLNEVSSVTPVLRTTLVTSVTSVTRTTSVAPDHVVGTTTENKRLGLRSHRFFYRRYQPIRTRHVVLRPCDWPQAFDVSPVTKLRCRRIICYNNYPKHRRDGPNCLSEFRTIEFGPLLRKEGDLYRTTYNFDGRVVRIYHNLSNLACSHPGTTFYSGFGPEFK